MHITIEFDERKSAMSALEIMAQVLGGYKLFEAKIWNNNKTRIVINFVIPTSGYIEESANRFQKNAFDFLDRIGLNPKIGLG